MIGTIIGVALNAEATEQPVAGEYRVGGSTGGQPTSVLQINKHKKQLTAGCLFSGMGDLPQASNEQDLVSAGHVIIMNTPVLHSVTAFQRCDLLKRTFANWAY